MATKTINLKMVLNRKAVGKELRQALWTTHEQINKAVVEIEKILLLCRGSFYFIPGKDKDDEIKADDIQRKALGLARNIQAKMVLKMSAVIAEY